MSDLSINETDEVTIADSAGVNKLTVNADGSIKVTGTGTPGTADSRVVTIQGVNGGVALPISSNSGIFSTQVKDATGDTLGINAKGQIEAVAIPNDEVEVLEGERYNISFDINLPTSGTETNFFLLRNPVASGKKVVIYRISACLTNTVGVLATLKMYADPTITSNGTSQAIVSSYIGGGMPAASSTSYTLPTISVRGTRMYATNVQGGTSGTFLECDMRGSYILAPGHDLLWTGTPDGTNRTLSFTIALSEEL